MFVTEFDELSKVSLNQKIFFLEKHGFYNLSNLFNRNFRNAVAHLSLFSSPNHQSPKSVIQYYQSKGKKRKITEITLEELEKWNRNIGMFHRYFNNQFLRVV